VEYVTMFSKILSNVKHVKNLCAVIAKLIGSNKTLTHAHFAEIRVNLIE
jgi:hypothetical protein